MKPSEFQIKKIEELKKKARILYESGLSTREVGKVIHRSHAWVALVVKELSTGKLD